MQFPTCARRLVHRTHLRVLLDFPPQRRVSAALALAAGRTGRMKGRVGAQMGRSLGCTSGIVDTAVVVAAGAEAARSAGAEADLLAVMVVVVADMVVVLVVRMAVVVGREAVVVAWELLVVVVGYTVLGFAADQEEEVAGTPKVVARRNIVVVEDPSVGIVGARLGLVGYIDRVDVVEEEVVGRIGRKVMLERLVFDWNMNKNAVVGALRWVVEVEHRCQLGRLRNSSFLHLLEPGLTSVVAPWAWTST